MRVRTIHGMVQSKETHIPPPDIAAEAGSQGLVRVLVVDNDIVHARTMGEVLSRLAYQVVVVGSHLLVEPVEERQHRPDQQGEEA